MADGTRGEGPWFTHVDGIQHGPLAEGDVRQQFLSGRLKPMDGVWCAGWPAWLPAGEVFKSLVVPPPIQPFVSQLPSSPQHPIASKVQPEQEPPTGDVGHVWIGSRKIRIHRFKGVVVDLQRSSRTHVSGGQNNTPISSFTVNTHEVFIRLKDGSERSFDVEPSGVPVRPGNTLTVLMGFPGQKDRGWYTTIWNHDSKRLGHMPPGINKLAGPRFYIAGLTVLGLAAFVGVVMAAFGNPLTLILSSLGLGVLGAVIMKNRRKVRGAMEDAIADLRR